MYATMAPVRPRLAIVASHVIQYQDPLFARLGADPDVDLTVLYCSRKGANEFHDRDMGRLVRWDVDLLQGYRYRFMANLGAGTRWFRLINPGIVAAVLRGKFDAVIFMIGWGTVTSYLGLSACQLAGTPAFLFGDSSYAPAERTMVARARGTFLRLLFRFPRGFMTSGVQNATYYQSYGVDPSRFFDLPFAIDNERFQRAAEMTSAERAALRRSFGFSSDDRVVVFSGKLVPRKDPLTILRAVSQMHSNFRTCVLFLGDGELHDELIDSSAFLGVRCHFAGFVNQHDLPRHYAAGDVFVIPSMFEPRGLVVNEAMTAGLPVIASDRVGAIGDLVLPGVNGDVFPAGDAAALASILERVLGDDRLRSSMSQRSLEIISTWDYSRAVRGIKAALGKCANQNDEEERRC
jgi:glycosyltransferase involved in cell wall biosynthesis